MRALVGAGVIVLAGCTTLQPEPPAQPAIWTFAPDQQIGAGTTEFVAMVNEEACAGGRSSDGRIVGPQVDYVDDTSVIVTFAVRPLDGFQECPSNPSTPVTVRLEEPLGDRRLLDGGREPPSEPPECANPRACE
jgi:hypothetical protein